MKLTILLTILKGLKKHWKTLLPLIFVAVAVWYVMNLKDDLQDTQAKLSQLQEQVVIDSELQEVRDSITANNIKLERQLNETNTRVSNSLNSIRQDIIDNGSEMDQIKLKLHPRVIDQVQKELCDRGLRDCDND